jgi:hypothetical protein
MRDAGKDRAIDTLMLSPLLFSEQIIRFFA